MTDKDNVIKFRPTKNSTLPMEERRVVFTCRCGCQVFYIYSEGVIRCIACDLETPTLEVF